MTVKIGSKGVKICSEIIFTQCFIAKFSLKFVRICSEQILLFLIIPKSSCPIALTIANARLTLCAGSKVALTSFASRLATRKHGRRARSRLAACGARSLRGRMEIGQERGGPASIFVIDKFMVNLGNWHYASIYIAH